MGDKLDTQFLRNEDTHHYTTPHTDRLQVCQITHPTHIHTVRYDKIKQLNQLLAYSTIQKLIL